jgi:hypothetical protein
MHFIAHKSNNNKTHPSCTGCCLAASVAGVLLSHRTIHSSIATTQLSCSTVDQQLSCARQPLTDDSAELVNRRHDSAELLKPSAVDSAGQQYSTYANSSREACPKHHLLQCVTESTWQKVQLQHTLCIVTYPAAAVQLGTVLRQTRVLERCSDAQHNARHTPNPAPDNRVTM